MLFRRKRRERRMTSAEIEAETRQLIARFPRYEFDTNGLEPWATSMPACRIKVFVRYPWGEVCDKVGIPEGAD